MKEFGHTGHWLYQTEDTWTESKGERAGRFHPTTTNILEIPKIRKEEYAKLYADWMESTDNAYRELSKCIPDLSKGKGE